MMSDKALVVRNDEFTTLSTIARVAVASQYHRLSEPQAVYIVLKGYELGMSPLQSIDSIDIIQGKPTLKPQAMLALINQSGLLQDIDVDATDTAATCTMVRKGRGPHTETFTMSDATALGLAGKDNWKKQPKTMLKWRVIAAAARVVFPDVIQGCYTPDELGADVMENTAGEQVIMDGKSLQVEPVAPEGDVDFLADAPQPAPAQSAGTPAPSPFPAPVDAKVNVWKGNVSAMVRKAVHPYWSSPEHISNAINGLLEKGAINPTMTVRAAASVLTSYADMRANQMSGDEAIAKLTAPKEAQS